MSLAVSCPLCARAETTKLESMTTAELVSAWQKGLRLDIASELASTVEIELWRCESCRLEFFLPPSVVGSAELYVELEKFPWYYLPQKWEHDLALVDLAGSRKGLEIGSGFGAFVERARAVCPSFEGSEQNPSALAVAAARGIPVSNLDLGLLIRDAAGQYDAVCSFQVLEHVGAPGVLLSDCCSLLRTGGKLMLGLPNANSYLKHYRNLLDMPPHHMSRWSEHVLQAIPTKFPLRLVRVEYEPLPAYQVESFVQAYTALWAKRASPRLASRRVRRLVEKLLAFAPLRRGLLGQAMYALYCRN